MKQKILFFLLSILLPLSNWAQEAQWQCNEHLYKNEMTAYVVLNVSDAVVKNYANFEVAAFCGEECRGVAEFMPTTVDEQVGYLRIYSNKDVDETITFQAYDKASKKLMAMPDAKMNFKANDTQGMPSSPVALTALYDFKVDVALTGGTGTVSEGAIVRQGSDFTVTATPETGYHLEAWVVNGRDVSTETSYTFKPDADLTLTARLAPNKYTITYLMDDGETVYLEETFAFGATVIAPAYPQKEGHSFTGWNETVASKMPAQDLSYTAKFSVNQYKVTFKAVRDGIETILSEETLDYGSSVTKPADPEWEGHTFVAWTPEVSATVPARNVTYEAAYDDLVCKVTYKVDGAEYEVFSAVKYGQSVPAVTEPPSREGYTFSGWGDVPQTMPANDIVINGTFNVNTYKIQYRVDGADYKVVEVNYGQTIPEETAPEKDGYTFGGWSEYPETMPAQDIVVSGHFSINQYKVTFVVGGSLVYNEFQDYGTPIVKPEDPTKEGYTFTGWTPEVDETVPSHKVSYTAEFSINQYTMTFVLDNGEENVVKKQDYATALEAPADPTKTGFTFKGWSSEVPATIPAEDKIFTAQWEINQYTMTFKLGNGEADVVKKQDYDSELTAPADFTKTGYTFTGWDAEIPAKIPAEDKTFTAQWKINQYTVKFVADGTDVYNQKQDYNSAITAPEAPTKEGHTFKEWTPEVAATVPAEDVTYTAVYTVNTYKVFYKVDDADYKTVEVKYGEEIPSESAPEKEGYTFSGWSEAPATMPASDVTITGSFAINQYKVKFVIGEEVISEQTLDYGTTINAPEAPLKEGYTFAGWGEVAATVPAKDVTYTGSYTVNTYKVFYKVDDADYKTVEVKYGEEIPSESAPEKEGYTFSGWSEAPATMPASDVTITGSFSINQYTVKFIIGEEVISEQTLDYGSPINAPEAPLKEGYTFAGWGEVAATVPAKDVTYTGSYTVNVYVIRYYVNGELVAEDKVEYGAPVVLRGYEPEDPNRYTFIGWIGETFETMPAHDLEYQADISDGISAVSNDGTLQPVYRMDGSRVNARNLRNLPAGAYIIGGKKVIKK